MHPTRIFKHPDELKQAWEEYKADRDEEAKKWAKIQYVGKDGNRVEDMPQMPYSEDGFCVWYKKKYDKYIHQYFKRTDEYEPEFLPIVDTILLERNDRIKTGTLLGVYNASMGNRITGLTDRTENKNENQHSGKIEIVVKDTGVPLANSENDIKLD